MKTFKLNTAKETYFESKEEYLDFVDYWSDNHKGTSAEVQFLYLLLRGKDIGKAFTPISNTSKMPSKGEHEYFALYRTYASLKWTFSGPATNDWSKARRQRYVNDLGGYIDMEQLKELIESTPHPKEWEVKV